MKKIFLSETEDLVKWLEKNAILCTKIIINPATDASGLICYVVEYQY